MEDLLLQVKDLKTYFYTDDGVVDVPSPFKPPAGCRFHPRCKYSIPICSQEEPELIDIGNEHYVACHLRK